MKTLCIYSYMFHHFFYDLQCPSQAMSKYWEFFNTWDQIPVIDRLANEYKRKACTWNISKQCNTCHRGQVKCAAGARGGSCLPITMKEESKGMQ